MKFNILAEESFSQKNKVTERNKKANKSHNNVFKNFNEGLKGKFNLNEWKILNCL